MEERFPRPIALPERIDGILVLGGAVDPALSLSYGETVFNSSVARVLAGVALARRHPEAKLALIGGEGGFVPVGLAELRATLGFVVEQGIAPERIILEERSRSTHENAVYAKELIRPLPGETWILVTSAFHMPRAVASFEAVDWPVIPYPVDYKIDPRTGLRREFQPARRARRNHPRGQGVGRSRRLPPDGMDAPAVSGAARLPAGAG